MIYYVISLLSQIYVDGPILEAVQDSWIYNDSKHFVDMPLKIHPIETLKDFQALGDRAHEKKYLKKFLEEHFEPPGGELRECYPADWRPSPSTLAKVTDPRYRQWALALHRIWRELCRQVREEVKFHPELNSILYVPNPFIVPGGRFREFYYWDTYWIVKGLLFSEMYETSRGVIRNLAYMVDNHGFIPNGGRVYYLLRSQPPMFIPMVYDYYIATGDMDFVVEMLPSMEREFAFWMSNRATSYSSKGVELFKYFRYKVNMKTPRPESYREDKELTEYLPTLAEKKKVWSHIASAAETGWDFSSRWFAKEGNDADHMRSIRTMSIVPVDLNAFMCMNARMMANFFEIAGNQSKAEKFHGLYQSMKLQMSWMHWNETDGIWYDYDVETKRHVNVFYISNALPIFAKCFDDETDPRSVHKYLLKTGALNFTKGIPTSLNFQSEQQWDSSNAWPPLVHMIIEGFRTSGDPMMYSVAKELAQKWLRISYISYQSTNAMFEKYNASAMDDASRGQGGEYDVQTGFGWTNGVVLDLLGKFASLDETDDYDYEIPDFQAWSKIVMPVLLLLFTSKFIRIND